MGKEIRFLVPANARISTCRDKSCNAAIAWRGKQPLHWAGRKQVDGNWWCESHHAHCPGAARFRKKKPSAKETGMIPKFDYDHIFTYHSPPPEDRPKYHDLRDAAKVFALAIEENVPDGADKSHAIRCVREAVMTGNAGIALGGRLFVQSGGA